jgi:hypothetical protein
MSHGDRESAPPLHRRDSSSTGHVGGAICHTIRLYSSLFQPIVMNVPDDSITTVDPLRHSPISHVAVRKAPPDAERI